MVYLVYINCKSEIRSLCLEAKSSHEDFIRLKYVIGWWWLSVITVSQHSVCVYHHPLLLYKKRRSMHENNRVVLLDVSSQVIFCCSALSSSSVVRPSVSQVTSYHAHDSVRVTRNNNSSSSNSKRVVIWSMITDRLCSFNLLPLLFGKLFSRLLLRPCEKNRFLLTAFFKANHYRPINLFCSEGKNLSDIKMKKITAGNFR